MILALDTATKNISIALHDGQNVIAEMTWRTANRHTVELAPAVNDLMARVQVKAADLTALAVTLGPGSYTGLRIGMSFAKGMALAVSPSLPLIGIPTLDVIALAQQHVVDHLYAVTAAGRGRINAGMYAWREGAWQSDSEPCIITWDALAEQITPGTLVAGEIDKHGHDVLTGLGDCVIVAPAASNLRRAGFLAELAYRRLRSGQETPAAALAPAYLS